jgi:glutamyl-tRNA reductase
MQTPRPTQVSDFFVAGINYKKTDAAIRGQFAINNEQYGSILELASVFKADGLFILSTCNRTEIYGFAESSAQLVNLLCTQTAGDAATFNSLSYIKNGIHAVEHLFNVGAGLDSQILGDYEIIGQLKQAVKFSKEHGHLNCFLERLSNYVLQSSKMIKNETALSGGTVSVSFAAIQYIKENVTVKPDTKILLVGTGKIGRNTCKNLVDYLGTTNITLINRSEDKAIALAAELGLNYAPIAHLATHIADANVILVASNACEPVVLKSHLENKGSKLIIDLSIPYNVESSVCEIPEITLINVDTLSKLKDETIQKREAEKPAAQKIIAGQLASFMEWYYMRKNAPALSAIKKKLSQIYQQQESIIVNPDLYPVAISEEKIQKVVNYVASKMRTQNNGGCQYIEAINEFMSAKNN